jgi:hypothetical protein
MKINPRQAFIFQNQNMKLFYLLLLVVLTSGAVFSQQLPSQVQAKRGVFTERLFLHDRWIDRISTDINNSDSSNNNVLPTTKAVADYLRLKGKAVNSEWVSVSDFGAIPNDTTNDYTTNIQEALNSGAGTILVPAGLYIVTDILRINSNQTLLAYGARFIRKANTSAVIINNADGVTGGYDANTNIKVIGLTIDGNMANYPANCTLLAFGHTNLVTVKDCEFVNCPIWHNIEFNAVRDGIIDKCSFHHSNTTSEMVQLDLMVANNVFPWFGPYDNTPCKNVIVSNCVFFAGLDGIGSHSYSTVYPHSNIQIINNYFHNLTGTAVKPYNYTNLLVTGNSIDSCLHGIRTTALSNIDYIRNYAITNNNISNLTLNSVEGRAINIHYCSGLTITGNKIDNITRHAIGIDFCNKFTVHNNIIYNYGITSSINGFGIVSWASGNGSITDNIVTGVSPNTNNVIMVSSWLGLSSNIIIDGNICTMYDASRDYFNEIIGANIIMGSNFINGTCLPIKTITASQNYISTYGGYLVNTSGGNVTLTVNPFVFNKNGLVVRKISTDSNLVTIVPSSGTINGEASLVLRYKDQSAVIKSDFTNLITTGDFTQ